MTMDVCAYPLLVPVIYHVFPQIAKANFPLLWPERVQSEFTGAITHALLRNNDGQRPSLPPTLCPFKYMCPQWHQ